MKNQITPWRAVQSEEGFWQVWTAQDDTLGSKNNYVIAGEIQREDEARAIAALPALVDASRAVLDYMTEEEIDEQPALANLRAALDLALGETASPTPPTHESGKARLAAAVARQQAKPRLSDKIARKVQGGAS